MYGILVLSPGIAVGCFPGGSIPNDPWKPGCNHSSRMAVRNQQGLVGGCSWCVKIRHEELFVACDFMSTLEPVLMSLKPGLQVANPYQESHFGRGIAGSLSSLKLSTCSAKTSALKVNLIEEVNISNGKNNNIKIKFTDLKL